MNGPIMLNKSDKDEYYVVSLMRGICKVIQMNVYVKQTKLWLPKGRGRGRDKLGV